MLPLHLLFQIPSLCPLHEMVLGSHGISMCRGVFLLPRGRTPPPLQIKECEIDGKCGSGLTCFFHVAVGGPESAGVSDPVLCALPRRGQGQEFLLDFSSQLLFSSYQGEAFAWLLMQNNSFRRRTSVKRLPTRSPSIISFS